MQEDSGENGEGDSQGEFVVTLPQQQQQKKKARTWMDYIWAFVARYNFYSNFGKVGTRLERSAINQVKQKKRRK